MIRRCRWRTPALHIDTFCWEAARGIVSITRGNNSRSKDVMKTPWSSCRKRWRQTRVTRSTELL